MGRRDIRTTTQDPDVEKSRAELESIEGRKASAQAETLAVAENKKRLESDLGKSKETLEAEIEAKRTELADAEKTHQIRMTQITSEEQVALRARDRAVEAKDQAEKDNQTAQATLAETKGKNDTLALNVVALVKEEKRLKDSIGHLSPQVRILEKKLDKLTSELSDINKKIAAAQTEHSASIPAYEEEKRVHAELLANKNVKIAEVNAAANELAEVKKKISDANQELTEVQKKRAEHETAMQKREEEINTRNANASRLEQHVDEKLETLKKLEDKFSTEHLARVGYQKVGT